MASVASPTGSGLAALHLPLEQPATHYIEPLELEQALRAGAALVDVRSARERADGHLSRSVHLPAREWAAPAAAAAALEQLALLAGRPPSTLILYGMYSRDRAVRCARAAAAAAAGTRVLVLRGGFQQCMAQLWPGSARVARPSAALFASVRAERWGELGRQGLVWLPDLQPVEELLRRLTRCEPPWLPRALPLAFRKRSGDALRAALPYVCEVYGPHAAAAMIPGVSSRAHECGALLHLRCHTIPFEHAARTDRLMVLAVAAAGWLLLYPTALKVRCVVGALVYSFMELAFTKLERGSSYTSFTQFNAVLLYLPILLDLYGALLGDNVLCYILLFPANVWLLEVVVGHAIIWLHGHNVAWCYADYSDAFFNDCARLGHAPAWLALGVACFHLYPWLVAMTEGA
ncbi:hypothetical protein AB1Y20_019881 [Prymnesium parvum]|uniref:Rhodanese domain-containing protein n=1 Tax=Prymnesium parvum TaxID=97485 RepID=A0AB34JTK9_PRYPA